jgi:hypothetical protein
LMPRPRGLVRSFVLMLRVLLRSKENPVPSYRVEGIGIGETKPARLI